MNDSTHETDESRRVDPFTIRWAWFLVLWYLTFTTALMDLSRRVTIAVSAVLVATAIAVSAYASEA